MEVACNKFSASIIYFIKTVVNIAIIFGNNGRVTKRVMKLCCGNVGRK